MSAPLILPETPAVTPAQSAWNDLTAWSASQQTNFPEPAMAGFDAVSRLYRHASISSLIPILPIFLRLRGKPFSIENHFPMEPLYKWQDIPLMTVLMCGRQVSKSTTIAAKGVIRATTQPYFNQLFITPLCEQIQRFSNNFVRPFVKDSPLRSFLTGEGLADKGSHGKQNVFQRTFSNESNMFFSFAFLDCDRIRGIAADSVDIDEAQDMDWSFIPVIMEVLSASRVKLKSLSGTPKTSENTLSVCWDDTSQAHWAVKCQAGHYNIFDIDHDLDKMVVRAGLRCAKCGGPVNPRAGQWLHKYPDVQHISVGWHVPQTLLPMHYEDENAWAELYRKKLKYPQNKYYNEILGVPCDVGSRLVTRDALQKCCVLPWDITNLHDAAKHSKKRGYTHLILSIDWGSNAGGEIKRRRGRIAVEGGTTSFTVASIVGFGPGSPTPELVYAERLSIGMRPEEEIKHLLELLRLFECKYVAHDYGGAGMLRETLMIQAGVPEGIIIPCIYVRSTSKPVMTYNPPGPVSPRKFYSLDKTRSLALLCSAINAGMMRFPRDWENGRSLYEDFLSLIEDHRQRAGASDVILITNNPLAPDDFAHSLNLGCQAHWYITSQYPNLAEMFGINLLGQNLGLDADEMPEHGW